MMRSPPNVSDDEYEIWERYDKDASSRQGTLPDGSAWDSVVQRQTFDAADGALIADEPDVSSHLSEQHISPIVPARDIITRLLFV